MGKPKIRFKGFTEDWEQSKLEDLCNFINGDRSSNYPNATDFQVNGIPFVGSDSLGMTYINKNKLRFISTEKYFQMKGLKIQKGDILYTLRGAGFGKCSISDFSEGTIASSLVGIRCSELLKSLFLIQWLNSTNAENEKKKAVNGSTAQNISVEDMKLYIVYIPTIEEQEKISEYLLNLDNLITLHQRKCDETKKLKNYMLQKMFPQNGMKVPEIRFGGFTGDWEQRKLLDISDIVTGTTPQTKDKDNYDGNRLFVSPADIQGNRFIERTITTLTEKGHALGRELRPGTSLFVSIGSTIGKVAQIEEFVTTNQQINAVIPYDKMEDDFVFTMLENEADKIKKLSAQQAVPIMNKSTFGNIEVKYPKKEEQMKIGKYFKELDHLITLHQRKCDELMKIKKYMLQNMFV